MLIPGKLYKLISKHGFFIQKETNVFDFSDVISFQKNEIILFIKRQKCSEDEFYTYNVFSYKSILLYNRTKTRDNYFAGRLKIINE